MKVGDTVYYVVSSVAVREATVVWLSPGLCTLRYRSGGICLPRKRVFETREEAEAYVAARTPTSAGPSLTGGSQMELREAYDFSGRPLD